MSSEKTRILRESKFLHFQFTNGNIYLHDFLEHCKRQPLEPIIHFLRAHPFLVYNNVDFQTALVGTYFPIYTSYYLYPSKTDQCMLGNMTQVVLNCKRLELFLLGLGCLMNPIKSYRTAAVTIWKKHNAQRTDMTYDEKDAMIAWPGGYADFWRRQAQWAVQWQSRDEKEPVLEAWMQHTAYNGTHFFRQISCELNSYFAHATTRHPHLREWFAQQTAQQSYTSLQTSECPEVLVNHQGQLVGLVGPTQHRIGHVEDMMVIRAIRRVLHFATLAVNHSTPNLVNQMSLYHAMGSLISVLSIGFLFSESNTRHHDALNSLIKDHIYYATQFATAMTRPMLMLGNLWFQRECLGFSEEKGLCQMQPYFIAGCCGYEVYGLSSNSRFLPYWLNRVDGFLSGSTRKNPIVKLQSDATDETTIWVFNIDDVDFQPNMTVLLRHIDIRVGMVIDPARLCAAELDEIGECDVLIMDPDYCTIYTDEDGIICLTPGTIQRKSMMHHPFHYHIRPSLDAYASRAVWDWITAFYSGGFHGEHQSREAGLYQTDFRILNNISWVPGIIEWIKSNLVNENRFLFLYAALIVMGTKLVKNLDEKHASNLKVMSFYNLDWYNGMRAAYVAQYVPKWFRKKWLEYYYLAKNCPGEEWMVIQQFLDDPNISSLESSPKPNPYNNPHATPTPMRH